MSVLKLIPQTLFKYF